MLLLYSAKQLPRSGPKPLVLTGFFLSFRPCHGATVNQLGPSILVMGAAALAYHCAWGAPRLLLRKLDHWSICVAGASMVTKLSDLDDLPGLLLTDTRSPPLTQYSHIKPPDWLALQLSVPEVPELYRYGC